jgi:type IV pilus secretin PilQ/predicted competence protein
MGRLGTMPENVLRSAIVVVLSGLLGLLGCAHQELSQSWPSTAPSQGSQPPPTSPTAPPPTAAQPTAAQPEPSVYAPPLGPEPSVYSPPSGPDQAAYGPPSAADWPPQAPPMIVPTGYVEEARQNYEQVRPFPNAQWGGNFVDGPPRSTPLLVTAAFNEPAGNAMREPVSLPPPLPGYVPPVAATPGPAEVRVGGGPVQLHADALDINKAMEILSRQAKVNILVSPNVKGQVTVDLRDVSVDEALHAVLSLCHLSMRRDKDIIYVYDPIAEGKSEEQDTNVRVYQLNYARGADLVKMVKPLLSAKGQVTSTPQSDIGIKADADKVGGDSLAGGEILIVRDSERVLRSLDRVIPQLDAQPLQVLIEAVIIRVKLEKGHDIGVNFGLLNSAGTSALGLVGDGNLINAAGGFPPAGMVDKFGKLSGNPAMGFAQATDGLKVGVMSNQITGFIQCLETIGKTKVLASPKLLVLNKQRAELQLGDRLAYSTVTQTQTSTVQTVQFMNVGVQLRLRPFISNDGMVRMEIHPEHSSGKVENNLPQTNSSEVTTNVMVPDGMTIVIGGLMENEDSRETDGIPFLMKIPVIGWLFKHDVLDRTQNELIVVLTPHIWRPKAPGTPGGANPPPGAIPPPCRLPPVCNAWPVPGIAE